MLEPQLPEGRVVVPDATRANPVTHERTAVFDYDVVERVVQSLLHVFARGRLVVADTVFVIALRSAAAAATAAAAVALVIGAVIK